MGPKVEFNMSLRSIFLTQSVWVHKILGDKVLLQHSVWAEIFLHAIYKACRIFLIISFMGMYEIKYCKYRITLCGSSCLENKNVEKYVSLEIPA